MSGTSARRPIHAAGCPSPMATIHPRQDLLQARKELLPSAPGTAIGLRLIPPEARLLHAKASPRARRGDSPGDDTFEAISFPGVRQRLVRLDDENLTVDDDV